MPGRKGMVHYPKSTKLIAVKMFYEEGKTYREITGALGVYDEQRIGKWLIEYRRCGDDAFNKPKGRPKGSTKSKVQDSKDYIKQLEMENEMLKKFLELSGGCYQNR